MSLYSSSAAIKSRPMAFSAVISNPGALYNVGNGIAFIGALLVVLTSEVLQSGSVIQGLEAYFLGSWPALCATIATALFWIGGMKYAAAWLHGFPPDPQANVAGHAFSTAGAFAIGLALIGLARTEVALALALIATIMHVGGKLASWKAPENDSYFKAMPLYSRVPYVTTLCLDLRSDMITSSTLSGLPMSVLLPLTLMLATMFWARADWLLLPQAK